MAQVQAVVDGYPGLFHDVLTYLKERIKEVLTGAGATVVVRIFGPDLAVLREKAHDVEEAMKAIQGVTNLKVEPQIVVPQLDVKLRPEAAAPARPDPRRRPPVGDHARQRDQGGRALQGAEDL